jgi:hypothetical protein
MVSPVLIMTVLVWPGTAVPLPMCRFGSRYVVGRRSTVSLAKGRMPGDSSMVRVR